MGRFVFWQVHPEVVVAPPQIFFLLPAEGDLDKFRAGFVF